MYIEEEFVESQLDKYTWNLIRFPYVLEIALSNKRESRDIGITPALSCHFFSRPIRVVLFYYLIFGTIAKVAFLHPMLEDLHV